LSVLISSYRTQHKDVAGDGIETLRVVCIALGGAVIDAIVIQLPALRLH
jgi:hypothetical protein